MKKRKRRHNNDAKPQQLYFISTSLKIKYKSLQKAAFNVPEAERIIKKINNLKNEKEMWIMRYRTCKWLNRRKLIMKYIQP